MPGGSRKPTDEWGTAAKLLHWSVALLVLAQFPLGWLAAAWRVSPVKLDLFVWHKSVGAVVLALMAVRLAWRLVHGAPALPATVPPWAIRSATASHVLLYALLVATPVSGWVVNSAANIPFRIFWLVPLPAIVAPNKAAAEFAAWVHLGLCIALAMLVALHVAAAIWHHRVLRDDVLARMLPNRRRPP